MAERLEILRLIESGDISVEEGLRRLERVGQSGTRSGNGPDTTGGSEARSLPNGAERSQLTLRWVRVLWQTVFGVGVAMVAGGGLLLSRAYGREGMPGLTWGWVLFALGLVIMGLGWWLQQARWLTVRVREHNGSAFTIGLPLPLGLAQWLLRLVRPWVPAFHGVEVDELVLALRDGIRDGGSVVIDVDEGPGADKVEVRVQ